MNWLTSKTVLGALVAVVAWLLSPEVLATMNGTVAAILQAVGTLVSVVGLRAAVAKAALGQPK